MSMFKLKYKRSSFSLSGCIFNHDTIIEYSIAYHIPMGLAKVCQFLLCHHFWILEKKTQGKPWKMNLSTQPEQDNKEWESNMIYTI